MSYDLSVLGPIWDGSGARGLSGEGYWFHRWLYPWLRPFYEHSTFVAKTVTAEHNDGHMPLTEDWQPKEWFPKCIKINFWKAAAINAVGLANPGLLAVLKSRKWHDIAKPFIISFMPIGPEETHEEQTRKFAQIMKKALCGFRSKYVAVQFNLTCPSVGADLRNLYAKAKKLLPCLVDIGVPVIIKINVLVPPEEAAEIAKLPGCAGLCVSNTVPYGELPFDIDWEKLFGEESPFLQYKFAKGGLSGAPIFDLVVNWVERFRELDKTTYVNAGGGITKAKNVRKLYAAGANSVSIASVLMLRPWRVPRIVRMARYLFGK